MNSAIPLGGAVRALDAAVSLMLLHLTSAQALANGVTNCFPVVDDMLVIDRTGSMAGQKYSDARQACSNFVRNPNFTACAGQAGLVSYNTSATLDPKLNDDWGVFGGVQFQDVGRYSHVESGKQAGLDLSQSLFVTLGGSYSF